MPLRKVCGVGPGLVFAARLLSTGAARRVGLVPCAIGGTEMDRWVPGADLFEQMVCHANLPASLARLASLDAGPVLMCLRKDAALP